MKYSLILLMFFAMGAIDAHAQIASRLDPCDPRRNSFDLKECQKYRQEGVTSKVTVGARIEWGTAAPIHGDRLEFTDEPDIVASQRLVEDWGIAQLLLRSEDYDLCNSLGYQNMGAACLDEALTRNRERYQAHYEHLAMTPVATLEQELRLFYPERSAALPSSRLQSVLLSYRALAQADSASMLRVLREEGPSLPVRERLLLVQRLGGIFLGAYDHERNTLGLLAKGGVTLDELLAFHRSREIEHPRNIAPYYGFPPEAGPRVLGVCRDIASAQGEMLQAMGFAETYVVAYFPTGALHTTLITEDPQQRGKYYRINYSRLNTVTGSGPEMLYQDDGTVKQDSTLRYFIQRPGGETLATVPSELGLLITRALRGDDAMERLAPGYLPKGWLTEGSVDFDRKVALKIFTGNDSRGDRYSGGGITVNFGGETSIYRQEMGVAGFLRDAGPIATANLYSFYEGTFQTKDLTLGDAERVKLHAEAMFYVAALIGDIYNLQEIHPNTLHKPHYAADMRAAFALEALFGRKTDRVQGSMRVEAQFTPGVGDIRDVTTARAQLDQVVAEGSMFYVLSQSPEGRAELQSTAAGQAYLYGIVTAMFDYWGQRGVTRIGLNTRWIGMEGRYSGRIQSQSPIFRPAAVRELAARLSLRLGSHGLAYAEATRPLEGELFDGVGPQVRVGGELKVRLGGK